jgi:hypothetical protein
MGYNFVFLDGLKTVAQVRNFVNGKNSLIASNKWQVVSKTQNVQYSWAKEKIVGSTVPLMIKYPFDMYKTITVYGFCLN